MTGPQVLASLWCPQTVIGFGLGMMFSGLITLILGKQ